MAESVGAYAASEEITAALDRAQGFPRGPLDAYLLEVFSDGSIVVEVFSKKTYQFGSEAFVVATLEECSEEKDLMTLPNNVSGYACYHHNPRHLIPRD